MKKIISLLICFNLINANFSFALSQIEDDLVNLLNKNLKIKKEKYTPIEDELVINYHDKNLKIVKPKIQPITDDFANNTLNKNLKIQKPTQKPIEDELVNLIPKDKLNITEKKLVTTILDYKAKIYPLNYHTTRRKLAEGQYIKFALAEDLKIGNKIYKKSTPIEARVENISMNAAYGVPADLIIGNFTLPDKTVLNGEISIKGANRTLWVYPTGYILTLFLFIGLPIFAIRGGHAKLKPNKTYKIEI